MQATARKFVQKLKTYRSEAEREKYRRYFTPKEGAAAADEDFIGVQMGRVFALSEEFKDMAPAEIEKLLESPIHEARSGALKIMAKQASSKSVDDARRKELFDLYLRRTDRINNWDLVDLAAPDVIGRYLIDKPRRVLYRLARSKDPWQRRSAIVATLYLVRQGEVEDTFELAELLVRDRHELVQKAVGGLLREAGKKDRKRLISFLGTHADRMPRTMLRYATEQLNPAERKRFGIGRNASNGNRGTRRTATAASRRASTRRGATPATTTRGGRR